LTALEAGAKQSQTSEVASAIDRTSSEGTAKIKSNIEETLMKNKVVANAAVLVLLTLAGLGSGHAQSNSPACDNRLIQGNYGFTIKGTKLAGMGPAGPQTGVAMTEFDGKGTFTQIDTVTINGEVVADFTHPRATGTYAVNSDCTGTFTINFKDDRPTVVTNFVVVEDGSEIDTVVTSAGGNEGVLALGSIGKRRFARH
jgi:hypothetical protein